ncbi:MAG TPA: hypothetical protein PKX05_03315, partial [bacterium]|nr:hypothetical protein [bacterium]
MNTQKKIILSLVIVWVILLILFGFVHSGFLFGGKVKVYFFQSQDNNLYLVSVEKKIKQLMPEKSEKIRFV